MTPAAFFETAKEGTQITLGDNSEPWEVLSISQGSHARIARKSDTKATFAYLNGGLLRFENLQGPSFSAVEVIR